MRRSKVNDHGFPGFCAACEITPLYVERDIFADWKNLEYRGSDDRDVAFGVECDVGASEGSGTADTEHATVKSAAGTRATDITYITHIICRAKSMLFLYLSGYGLLTPP